MKKLYCCFVISLFWATPCAARVIISGNTADGLLPTVAQEVCAF